MADGFAHAPFYAVADDRFADGAGSGETEPSGQFACRGSQTERGKIAAGHAYTGLIDVFKLLRPQNSIGFRK